MVTTVLRGGIEQLWKLETAILQLSLAKIPSILKSLTFSDRRDKTSTDYEETTKTILDPLLEIQEASHLALENLALR